MRDAIRSIQSDRIPMRVLRATLASLGFGKKNEAYDDAERWTAPTGLSVTIQPAKNDVLTSRALHKIGNVQVFELPPGATVDGRFLKLSPMELSILLRLARTHHRFVTLVELSRSVRTGAAVSLRALTVHVFELRRKLAVSGASATITTRRTLGYMLSDAISDQASIP
jgi:DNA-binding response OmpR family regulator